MPHADFVHLRVHTAYSLSEGAIRVKDLVKRCRDLAMPAVAITDTDNLFGALEFSVACAGEGIQPIIGCQLSLWYALEGVGAGQSKAGSQLAKRRIAPVVVLCQNDRGYRNLLKLLGKAYLGSPDDDDPHVTLDMLAEHAEGLIALSGGPDGPLDTLLAAGQTDAAENLIATLGEAFPGHLYIEVQRHGLESELRVEPLLIDLADRFELPLLATNEAFFPDRAMYEAHDALICIAEGAYVSQDDRRRLTPEHGFKPADEMRALFADLPEALDNTLVVARRCAFMVEKVKPILPPYDCGDGRDEEAELRAQARVGLEKRLEAHVFTAAMDAETRQARARPYRERLDYELGVIAQMGFPGYFLIVADFIQWAKDHGIPVGPGRGSGAGSLVAYSLTITDLDPLRWGLLFERFLNPERVSMPDFDVDFCQDRRDEVIRYVQGKYGHDKVAQIITFGKLQARAALRDVGRVLEMPYGQVDKICKLVPNNPAKPLTLDQALEAEPQLRERVESDEDVGRLMGIARQLEGLYRHASTHAAGVVIGDRPLDELIPLYRDPRSDMPVTGFNMKFVEQAGLVKYDFLGLKTLTVLSTAVTLIAERGVPLDLSTIPLDDGATFELLGRGDTVGVFQLESSGMQDVLKKMKPDTFADIIAVVALYRPGPMDNIPSYIRRKQGDEDPDYLYPSLEPILKETFGIMIYQEQVMQIAQELAGFSLGGADLLRRAMGKKIQEEMDKQRAVFVDGAKARGVPEKKASDIFDQVAKFASYGFNKSHAAAYALVAYQTAYLKANYPVEFLAASMTLDQHNTDKLANFKAELDRQKVALLPPDVNRSGVAFTVERDQARQSSGIRYALAAVKNVGAAAMASLVEERNRKGPYRSLADFANRLDTHTINKRQLENLVRAGAIDGLEKNRRRLFEGLETVLAHASAATREREDDQIGLFGGGGDGPAPLKLKEVPDWPMLERLAEEQAALGFFLSAHPLDAYAKTLKRLQTKTIAQVRAAGRSGPVNLAGTVTAKKERVSAKGSRYAFVGMTDTSGTYEITVFSEILTACRDILEVGQSLFVKVNVQFEGEGERLTTQTLEPLDKAAAKARGGLKVFLDTAETVARLKEALGGSDRGGRDKLIVVARPDPMHEVELELPGGWSVSPEVFRKVQAIPGVAAVEEL